MSRTYDPSLLLPINPSDLACARTWVRLWLRNNPDAQGKYPEHDLQDSEYEAARIPGAQARPIPTIWGHLAPFNPADQAFIDAGLNKVLDA